ncbi:serine-rich adhesin for platelets-like [Drosophila tropicalis]|uniref:serine-rich adhesin for platelets-like n=1 Tax=Drosophila tropicalis TaxID=46794 RepID=UPI0035AB724B
MSQSVRSSKSCQVPASVKNNVQLSAGGSVPHKFSSIVNKVESLISKMHHDKVNNFKLLQQQGQNQHQQGQGQGQGHGHGQEASCKCASLDSLNNLTDADSCEEHEMLYTDSDDAEIAHITGTTSAQVHHQQQMALQRGCSNLDQLTNESIRDLNEQCCISLGAELNGASASELDNDNAWSVEEDIVYKCCNSSTITTSTSHSICNSTSNSISVSTTTSLCEQCCYEEQLQLNQRDNNNNNNNDEQLHQQQHQSPTETDDKSSSSSESEQMVDSLANTLNSNSAAAANCTLGLGPVPGPGPGPSPLTMPTPLLAGNLLGNKTRRVSNASSGSVSRMETILEEPTESKISVKEILARFETMNTNEVGQNTHTKYELRIELKSTLILSR